MHPVLVSLCRLSVVASFADLFDYLGTKCIQIARFARCDQRLIHDNFAVLPVGARVHQIGFDGWP